MSIAINIIKASVWFIIALVISKVWIWAINLLVDVFNTTGVQLFIFKYLLGYGVIIIILILIPILMIYDDGGTLNVDT